MNDGCKVIAIVLESAEPSLVEQWCAAGKLPVLDRLRRAGVWMRLNCPSHISSGSCWPSMNIGTNPGKHGIGFFHRELKNGTYRVIKKYADQVAGEPFWERLGDAGLRNCIFDVPVTRPSDSVSGVIVVDWGSEHPAWTPSSHPKGLLPALVRQFGKHPLADWYQHQPESKEESKAIANQLLKGIALRTRLIKHLLETNSVNFALCNFAEPHWAGHIFWHLHDKNHPQHDAEIRAHCGDVLLDTYRASDKAVGDLVRTFPDANVLVISNIGMGPHAGGDMMVSEVLDRLGMSGKPLNGVSTRRGIRDLVFGERRGQLALQRVEALVGVKNIARVKRWLPERIWDEWSRRFLDLGNNWGSSLAFPLPADNSTLIRINLIGREPRGRVQPGEEYDRICEELSQALTQLVEPKTGRPAVNRVVKLREELSGDRIDHLPDLAVVWNNFGGPIEALESSRIGRIELKEHNKRPGGHWHEGFMLASGPLFRQGIALDNADLMDIAPTILALYGVEKPSYMDGRVIEEAFSGTPVTGKSYITHQDVPR